MLGIYFLTLGAPKIPCQILARARDRRRPHDRELLLNPPRPPPRSCATVRPSVKSRMRFAELHAHGDCFKPCSATRARRTPGGSRSRGTTAMRRPSRRRPTSARSATSVAAIAVSGAACADQASASTPSRPIPGSVMVQVGGSCDCCSIAKIIELQRDVERRFAQERDRFLQVVALFAGHANLFALNLRLNLEFRILQ